MLRTVSGALALLIPAAAIAAAPPSENLRFSILRNGDPIGTATMVVRRDGSEMSAQTDIHIRVKAAFVTLYRFDQTQSERWADGRFIGLSSRTDDNGTVHTVAARSEANAIRVDADGQTQEVDRATIPASLWNPALVDRTLALDPQDGSVLRLHIVDRGDEQVSVSGHPIKAHRYSIESSFSEDVWYDSGRHLVKVELRASDGSTIEYRPN
jgi:hypothetical protein